MNPPLISVIIPLYNKATCIAQTLNSVLAQTISNFEIIVVNDGSTDGGEKIVEKYRDCRIKLINQKNNGVSAARNTGILNAHGKYISLLDADDEYLPTYLETILRLIEQYPKAGAYATAYYKSVIVRDKKMLFPAECIGDLSVGIQKRFFKDLQDGNFLICSSTATIPKKIFDSVGMFEEGVTEFEDHDLWCRIALYYDIIYSTEIGAIIHSEYSSYYQRCQSKPIPTELPFRKYISTLDIAGNTKINYRYYNDIARYLDQSQIMLAMRNLSFGKRKEARCCLSRVTKNGKNIRYYLACIISHFPTKIYNISITVGIWAKKYLNSKNQKTSRNNCRKY